MKCVTMHCRRGPCVRCMFGKTSLALVTHLFFVCIMCVQLLIVVAACDAGSATSASQHNSCPIASLAKTSAAASAGSSSSSSSSSSLPSSSHTVTVVTNSRHSLTDSVRHCVERPMFADSVRIAGNCVAPSSSSLSNHSSPLRALGPACASTAVSFSSAPLLKSAGSAIHRMENVSRFLISDFVLNTD